MIREVVLVVAAVEAVVGTEAVATTKAARMTVRRRPYVDTDLTGWSWGAYVDTVVAVVAYMDTAQLQAEYMDTVYMDTGI